MLDITCFDKAVLFEHRFWLQILGDHSRFILNSLSPIEKKEIERASNFMGIFDDLLDMAHKPISGAQLAELTREAYTRAQEIRLFKLHLLKRHLNDKISTSMPPTFFNHMLNELDEYIRVLCSLLAGRLPDIHPVHYHLLWLLDGSGHAESIDANLDEVEHDIKEKSREYGKVFMDLYHKAVEMSGYLRTGDNHFPSLSRLNAQAEQRMQLFMDFLNDIKEKVLQKEVLGALMPIIPDHMFREECYYLSKLANVSEVKMPDCDPGKPRIEG